MSKKDDYSVITPAGVIYCTYEEAREYKQLYGYAYVKRNQKNSKQDEEE